MSTTSNMVLNKKIIIIGCGGSGKTTFAKELSKKTGFPVVHLDQLYWRAGWKHASQAEFDSLLKDELVKDSWIMDGNFNRTIQERVKYCDAIIYFDFPRITCLLGVIKRVLTNYGKTRTDMGVDCPEKFDMEFLKWVWNFNKNNRDEYYKILSNSKDRDIFIVHTHKECRKLINQLDG